MAILPHDDEGAGAPFHISERRSSEDALRRSTERQAMLLAVTSDLIRASEPGELGRKTFKHVSGALGAVFCANYRLDPAAQRLRLVFIHGLPSEYLEAAQSLELGQDYCGTVAATCQPLVADKQRIASDPKACLARELGVTAYAGYPLKASNGHLLGTFAAASTTRDSFTDDEVAWLGTITNFLAQAWERLEVEQGLRANEERLRLSQEAAGLGHWDYDYASDTLVWSEQTRRLLGVEPGDPASRALLRSRVHPEDHPRLEEHIARSARPDTDHIRHFEFRVVMPNGAVRWLEDQDRVETNAAGMPVRAVGVLGDITARKSAEEAQAKAEARIAADLRAMTILREMGGLYARKDFQLDECLQRTMDAAIAIVGADKGTLQLFDNRSNSLVFAAHHGFNEPFLAFFQNLRDDAAACAMAMQTKDQVIVEDVLKSNIFAGHQSQAVLINAGVRAVVSTPLMSSSGTLMGVISTHYTSPHRPTDREVSLIELLARQTADYLERKRAEQMEKTLVRELNHRCNNLLAVIQAIANQSLSGHYTVDESRTAFVARLQALARANRQLLKSDWSGVELHELVEAELEAFKTRVTIEGIPVVVRPQAAQNLSMALHELVTNASKHGALSSMVGSLSISWTISRENNPTVHFRWRERGGPRVVAPGRQGFGTALLKGMFPGIRFDYLEDGLRCKFDVEI